MPPGTDVAQIVDDFSRQITSSSNGVELSISSDDIDFDEQVIETAPKVYEAVNVLPVVFAVATLLFALALVLLAKSVGRGLKTLAWVLVANGGVTAFSFWLLTRIDFVREAKSTEGIDEVVFENIIKPFSNVVIADIAKTGITLGLIAVALGVIIWLSLYTRHKLHHEKKANKSEKKKPAKKIKDTTPSKRQESTYINKISKK